MQFQQCIGCKKKIMAFKRANLNENFPHLTSVKYVRLDFSLTQLDEPFTVAKLLIGSAKIFNFHRIGRKTK